MLWARKNVKRSCSSTDSCHSTVRRRKYCDRLDIRTLSGELNRHTSTLYICACGSVEGLIMAQTPICTWFAFLAVPCNQPKLIRNACWNSNAMTVVNNATLASPPRNLFVTRNNTWYTVTDGYTTIRSGTDGNVSSIANASGGYSIFVAGDDNVYTYDTSNSQVNRLSVGMTISQPVMYTSVPCRDLFVDTNNTLFCSLFDMHLVVSKSLNDPTNTLKVVAGTGCPVSTPDALYYPSGIFVSSNFTLYVADSSNNRVQRFISGQMIATTVAGNGASGTISLSNPTDIVLDVDGYLFIVDQNNHRIVGSGPDGFRCVIGCISGAGSASNQLLYPQSMGFDSYGNIWVADTNNRRIQKFLLKPTPCGEHHPSPCAAWNELPGHTLLRSPVSTCLLICVKRSSVFMENCYRAEISTESSDTACSCSIWVRRPHVKQNQRIVDGDRYFTERLRIS